MVAFNRGGEAGMIWVDPKGIVAIWQDYAAVDGGKRGWTIYLGGNTKFYVCEDERVNLPEMVNAMRGGKTAEEFLRNLK